MTLVWWTLGLVVYVMCGTLTFGVVMRLFECDWNADEFPEVLLSLFVSFFWPAAWLLGAVAGAAFVFIVALMAVCKAIRIDKALLFVVRIGNGKWGVR